MMIVQDLHKMNTIDGVTLMTDIINFKVLYTTSANYINGLLYITNIIM